MTWIQTYNSHKFFPAEPDHEENVIDIEDIAHALSMQCRFNGHVRDFYSVAQHSCHVANQVLKETDDPELALWGLLHDSAEAYLSDIPKPIKHLLTGYSDLEEALLNKIIRHFGLTWPQPDIVSKYDLIMLRTEQEWLMGPPPDDWGFTGPEALPIFPGLLKSPEEAEKGFLTMFYLLRNQIDERSNR